MAIQVRYLYTSASQFTIELGTAINNPPYDALRIVDAVDGSLRLSGLGPQYGGGMAAGVGVWPTSISNLTYAGLDFSVFVNAQDMPFLRCLECDVKGAITAWVSGANINNVANWSVQKNMAEGGMWQINDVNGNWIDTGFNPGPLAVGTWVPISLRFSVNWGTGKFSVLSITEGASTFNIPAALQNVTLLASNWGVALNLQLQTCLAVAGSLSTQYKNVIVTVSDTAF